MEEQECWEAHASFMNGLVKKGFVVLGGPMKGTPDVLLVVRAETQDEVVDRLSDDPWSGLDLLRVTQVAPWSLRLGSLS
ncbi:MAG: YciI family protein [Candidatus Eremiobacteraeota bacterium]|nr:YciI family protein [Candidatus Eremiobacteraeota bacterium]